MLPTAALYKLLSLFDMCPTCAPSPSAAHRWVQSLRKWVQKGFASCSSHQFVASIRPATCTTPSQLPRPRLRQWRLKELQTKGLLRATSSASTVPAKSRPPSTPLRNRTSSTPVDSVPTTRIPIRRAGRSWSRRWCHTGLLGFYYLWCQSRTHVNTVNT